MNWVRIGGLHVAEMARTAARCDIFDSFSPQVLYIDEL
jgi:hypothetical protein